MHGNRTGETCFGTGTHTCMVVKCRQQIGCQGHCADTMWNTSSFLLSTVRIVQCYCARIPMSGPGCGKFLRSCWIQSCSFGVWGIYTVTGRITGMVPSPGNSGGNYELPTTNILVKSYEKLASGRASTIKWGLWGYVDCYFYFISIGLAIKTQLRWRQRHNTRFHTNKMRNSKSQ